MSIAFALIRKSFLDVRWMLSMIAATCFGLCWLFVFVVHKIETGRRPPPIDTISLEMRTWENFPLFLLLIAVWSISRGSASVAGEIEKGTMDLILSRPVNRSGYLLIQLLVGLFGIVVIVSAMVLGNLTGGHYNSLNSAPTLLTLSKPGLNLVAYGWAIYGYTFLLSTLDHARWRPILISSVATLVGFITNGVAQIPQLPEWWRWIDKISIYKACKLLDAATTGEKLAFNLSILGLVGMVGVVLGFLIFARRDLPAGS